MHPGLGPLWWFFLAFGEEVRQAGSGEELVDHRGCLRQTLASCRPPQAAESHRGSCHRKCHHPSRENLVPGSSLPRMQNEGRQGHLPLHEDAGGPALAGHPCHRSPARPKVLLRSEGSQPSDLC